MSYWRRLNKLVIMPRIETGVDFNGLIHLMGLVEDSSLWSFRCDPGRLTSSTRPGGEITCMACLSERDSDQRRHGRPFRTLMFSGSRTHEAWTTGDLSGETICGHTVDLLLDQQVTTPVNCPGCLRSNKDAILLGKLDADDGRAVRLATEPSLRHGIGTYHSAAMWLETSCGIHVELTVVSACDADESVDCMACIAELDQ